MHLSKKELEVMDVLWETDEPMTVAEIIASSTDHTWSLNSIYMMIGKMEAKGALVMKALKPTSTNNARAYRPTISVEDYLVLAMQRINDARKPSVRVTVDKFIKALERHKANNTEAE